MVFLQRALTVGILSTVTSYSLTTLARKDGRLFDAQVVNT